MKKKILSFFNSIFHEKCMGCDSESRPEFYGFCEDCWRRIIFIENCGKNNNWSFAKYEGPIKKAICDFKYLGKKSYGKNFGKLLCEFIKRNDFPDFDLIIPIPLHWKKEFSRGFNQSAIISVYLGKFLKKPVMLGNLVKIKNTVSQTQLSESERKENVKGSFKVKKQSLIKGKNILLVDDVKTTGATTEEAKRVLKKNGAKKVIILTVASS